MSYLSPSDKARIEKELKEIRARRQATDDVPEGSPRYIKPREVPIDDGHLAAREAQLRRVLEKESAPRLDPSKRNAAWREFNTLVNQFADNAITKQEQGYGYPEIMKKREGAELDFERSKKKAMAWEMGPGQAVCHRLKQLAGVIDPDNPDLRNLENFRRRK